MPRSVSSSSNLSVADKRRSLLSIDGALDALKTREMWKGIKGVANPPNQVEEARKRGESAFFVWSEQGDELTSISGRAGNSQMGGRCRGEEVPDMPVCYVHVLNPH